MLATSHGDLSAAIGTGVYTAREASRLLRISPAKINRWLGGYAYRRDGGVVVQKPLWEPQLPRAADHLELGFRDLVELRFVDAFLQAGLGLPAIRACIETARTYVADDRPFSTRRFRTDGRKIFLETVRDAQAPELIDLRDRQYVFREVVDRTFKDLDIEDDAVVRWRPYQGRASIVIDPTRAFGKPITAEEGVPTVALADAVRAEGSEARVARLYDVAPSVVRDAVRFEDWLAAA